jgi:hypothetical protein
MKGSTCTACGARSSWLRVQTWHQRQLCSASVLLMYIVVWDVDSGMTFFGGSARLRQASGQHGSWSALVRAKVTVPAFVGQSMGRICILNMTSVHSVVRRAPALARGRGGTV